jgi:hypothetical protein
VIGSDTPSCGFVRVCFECDDDATHTIDAELYNDGARGDDSMFVSNDSCPRHAKAYGLATGTRATPITEAELVRRADAQRELDETSSDDSIAHDA